MPLQLPLVPDHPGIRTGTLYYSAPTGTSSTSTAVAAANTLYCHPFIAPRQTINRLAIEVTSLAAGNCRVGIASNAAGLPGALLVDGGALSTGSNAIVEATISDFVLPSDWVWLVCVFDATPTMRRLSGGSSWLMGNGNTSATGAGISATLSYGALPASMPAGPYTIGAFPNVWVRRA